MKEFRPLRALPLPKRVIERHGEWPDKIIEGSTLNGLNGHLRRHARVKLGIRNQFEFVLIDPNEHYVK